MADDFSDFCPGEHSFDRDVDFRPIIFEPFFEIFPPFPFLDVIIGSKLFFNCLWYHDEKGPLVIEHLIHYFGILIQHFPIQFSGMFVVGHAAGLPIDQKIVDL
jgi:hypothetical protein